MEPATTSGVPTLPDGGTVGRKTREPQSQKLLRSGGPDFKLCCGVPDGVTWQLPACAVPCRAPGSALCGLCCAPCLSFQLRRRALGGTLQGESERLAQGAGSRALGVGTPRGYRQPHATQYAPRVHLLRQSLLRWLLLL